MSKKIIPYIYYSATGNTFLAIDNRNLGLDLSKNLFWKNLSEKENVDGLLFVENSKKHDFKMVYLNRDGGEVEMCGNGARAISQFFSKELLLDSKKDFVFEAKNNTYMSNLMDDNPKVKMSEISEVDLIDISSLFDSSLSYYMKTGVPHCYFQVDDLENLDINAAISIRNNKIFPNGTNVNFFSKPKGDVVEMRTYERGVEAETKACGTGAVGLAKLFQDKFNYKNSLKVKMKGGVLTIDFDATFENVFLSGKVEEIRRGSFDY